MAQSNDRNKGIVGIFILVLVFFVIFMIFSAYTLKTLRTDLGDEGAEALAKSSKGAEIAVVEIEGVIIESKKIIEKIHRAEERDKTQAILLRINSPGGAVGPVQEIYEEVSRINDEGEIPVYASFGAISASGGYYIGAACKKIWTNAGTITGSIGVVMQFMNASKLMEWAKLKPEFIKAGKYKDFGQPHRSMTAEERNLLQGMMDNVHDQFMNAILKNRKDRIVGKITDHAQGQVFSGEQALKIGLVDGLGGLWQAGREIHKELKLESEFGLKFIRERKDFDWNKLFRNLDETITDIKQGMVNRWMPMFMMAR